MDFHHKAQVISDDALTGPLIRVVAPVANVATYGGAGGAIIFGLRADEFAAIAGVVIGLLGLLLKGYYERKRTRLQEEHYAALRRDAAEREKE